MIAWILTRLFGANLAVRVVPWLVLMALLGSTFLLGRIFHEQTKVGTWLFWRYAALWPCCLVFALACIAAGNEILARLGSFHSGTETDPLERFTVSFATGVFAFYLLFSIVGFLRGFGSAAFVGVPLLMFALGAPRARRDWRNARQRWREADGRLSLHSGEILAIAYGVLALAVLLLAVMVPENAAYDARWYHLGLAEHYAAAGGIVRSPEGSVPATMTHLASVLYAWAFCIPWGGLFERLELSAHLEFTIFVLSLPGIVAMVRTLVPGVRARWAWVVVFAFPSIFLYDSSLHSAADHIAALWAVPAYLVAMRVIRSHHAGDWALLAIQFAGLIMSKYTAAITIAGPLIAVVGHALWASLRNIRAKPRQFPALIGMGTAFSVGLVATSPHWLKNWLWYGDPMYPLLYRHLPLRPWMKDGPFILAVYLEQGFAAVGTLPAKLTGMSKALYDYSYGLYNWADFHGNYPVFGSLFTFILPAIFFLRGARRIWVVVVMIHIGIGIWYWLFHFERYLQTLLPWMVSCVVAIAILAWRSGLPARVGVVALCSLQLIWGSDMVFWPIHRMTGKSGIDLAADFFARGYGNADAAAARTQPFEDFAALSRGLPSDSKLLVHHEHLHTGLGTMVVADAPRIQYGLNYGELGSPLRLHERLRSWGVTHVVWSPQATYGEESLASELVFHTYTLSCDKVRSVGARTIASLPAQPPPLLSSSVLVHLCDGTYAPGRYELTDLSVSPYPLRGHTKTYPAPRGPVEPLAERDEHYGYAVVDQGCSGAPTLGRHFKQVAAASRVRFLVNRGRVANDH